jgi:spore coat protein H
MRVLARPVLAVLAIAGAGCAHVVPPPPPPIAATAPGRCQPTIGGRAWVEEGEALSVTVRCATGLPLARAGLTLAALPRGATYQGSELRWRPGLDQAGLHRVVAQAPGETAALELMVLDRFDHPGNVPVAAPADYPEERGVPVMHLILPRSAARSAHPGDYARATVVFRGQRYQAKIKVRGRSSLEYPKQNYTIKFTGHRRFSEPAAGMVGRHRIALTTSFDDNSQLRQRLAFEVWNRLAPGGIQIRHFSAVVFIDGRYHGLYTVTDHVDTDLLESEGISHGGGSLFRAVTHDAGFGPGPFRREAFEKRSGWRGPAWLGTHDELAGLWAFVAASDPARFAAQAGGRLALPEYRAWLIAVTAMQAEDSLAKNAFHFHDPASGRWRVVPWDFNESWGQDWLTGRVRPDRDPAALIARNHLFARLWEEPGLAGETRAAYASALRHQIALRVVQGLVERLAAELAPAARRDERRWQAEHRRFPRWRARTDFTDFPGEVAYLHRWIGERWAYLLSRPELAAR